jgi:hypothetical protein
MIVDLRSDFDMSLANTIGRLKEYLAHPTLLDAYQAVIGTPRCHVWFIEETLQAKAGERVLDICSVEASLRYLPDGVRYIGVDVSERCIRMARMRYGERGEFICLDLAQVDGDEIGTLGGSARRAGPSRGGPFCDHRPVLCPGAIEYCKMAH